jgi:hypothetical protein
MHADASVSEDEREREDAEKEHEQKAEQEEEEQTEEQKEVIEEANAAERRRRGRPPGSKNKAKAPHTAPVTSFKKTKVTLLTSEHFLAGSFSKSRNLIWDERILQSRNAPSVGRRSP